MKYDRLGVHLLSTYTAYSSHTAEPKLCQSQGPRYEKAIPTQEHSQTRFHSYNRTACVVVGKNGGECKATHREHYPPQQQRHAAVDQRHQAIR